MRLGVKVTASFKAGPSRLLTYSKKGEGSMNRLWGALLKSVTVSGGSAESKRSIIRSTENQREWESVFRTNRTGGPILIVLVLFKDTTSLDLF
jgi:hypothetical protein